MTDSTLFDVAILGGGPAGSAAGRLLSAWGHSVLILDTCAPRARGLAESLPPSTRKLLDQVGVLEAVEEAGFFRSTGNTVWWASGDRRVEPFGPARQEMGYQVHRPAFDRVLLDCARDAGAVVRQDARVRDVRFPDERSAIVEYDDGGRRCSAACRFVLDGSGRAGIVGRRFRRLEPGYRTCALVGVWSAPAGWDLPDETHTIVETYDEGWMWSVPISRTTRHVGAMVDRGSPTAAGGRALESAYRAETAKATNLHRVLEAATLERVWTLRRVALFVRPVRRVAVPADRGRRLVHRSAVVVRREEGARVGVARGGCRAHLPDASRIGRMSRWSSSRAGNGTSTRSISAARVSSRVRRRRATRTRSGRRVRRPTSSGARPATRTRLAHPDVLAAFERLRRAPSMHLTLADDVRYEPRPVIRDREIVLEDAFVARAGVRPPRTARTRSASWATSIS